jgi:type I restriction enzyme S subunit
MNKDWLHTKLGDIAKITCGIAATPEYVDESVGVPFLSARNVQDGKLDLSKFMYIPKELHKKLTKNTKPKKGDVLLTRVGAGIGKAAFVDIDFEFSVYVSLTLIQCKGMLDGNFLTFLLNTNYYQYLANRDQFAGGGVQNLNVQMVKGYPVSIPPLPEQIKIAKILSTWDNAINTVQKLLANSQQQKKSLMQQLLTGKKRFSEFEGEWEEKRLSRLLKVTGGNAFKSESFADTGVPLIKISNIKTDFSVSVDSCVFHPYEEEFAKFNVQYGDILIAMSGATTGKVGRYFGERLCYLNQRVGRFDLKKELASSDFIFQILKLPYIQHEILIDAVGGAQPNISNKEIERIKIKAPSLAEQQKIADVLTTADQEIDNLRAQLNHLKQEKKALMQQLLTGKRRVNIEEAA